jgi:hypothetical protein
LPTRAEPPHPRGPHHLGHRLRGPAVTIADATLAGPGDLVICTRNDHSVEAGEPGRTLANGDLLRIDAITRDGLLVLNLRRKRAVPPVCTTGGSYALLRRAVPE